MPTKIEPTIWTASKGIAANSELSLFLGDKVKKIQLKPNNSPFKII